MCGKIFSFPEYPESFILPNAEKFLVKKLNVLPKKSKERIEIKKLLKTTPVIKTIEQSDFVLPGNGFKICYTDNNEGMFCVLDGTCKIKEHTLPHNTSIVLASSCLGKLVIGKKAGEKCLLKEGEKERPFVIEHVIPPSKAKWPFKFENYLV